jgi:hypothetical protein
VIYEDMGHLLPLDAVRRGIIADMSMPVQCTCSKIYDLGKVEVTARYADCSMWKAPCCGRPADDRGDTGWKLTKDYHHIDKATGRVKW